MKNFVAILFVAVAFLGFGSAASAGDCHLGAQAIVVAQPQFLVNPYAVQVQAQAFAFAPQAIVVNQPQRIVVQRQRVVVQPQRIVVQRQRVVQRTVIRGPFGGVLSIVR